MRVNKGFSAFARVIAMISGRPGTFIFAFAVIIIWVVTGPIFNFSDTWQLVINTGTTIVTFLMVFLIQNTQNRDSEAMQIKLDELIFVNKDAHKALLDLEELSQEQLERIKKRYEKLAKIARTKMRKVDYSDD
jgi:low affinity Fe/Cu permease